MNEDYDPYYNELRDQDLSYDRYDGDWEDIPYDDQPDEAQEWYDFDPDC
jgi:hypothetical protein